MFKLKRIVAFALMFALTLGFSSSVFADTREENINIKTGVFKPNEMSEKEKRVYYASIEEEVEKVSKKYGEDFDKDWFREELIYVLETENSFEKIQSLDYNEFVPFAGSWIPDVKIRNDIAAAAINVAIDAALVAVGVGSVAALVKRIGLKEARRIFTRTLTTRLAAWGLGVLATSLPVAVDFIFNLLDPGTKIAEYLDSQDSFPNNGFIDIIL